MQISKKGAKMNSGRKDKLQELEDVFDEMIKKCEEERQ
jgi:hypothetical protein